MPPTPSLTSLLAESRWLESLARTLVTHPADADDLLQDVWTAAAEHAPSRVDHPRAWLATVLRNVLHGRRRADGPRTSRERAAARAEALPATDDVVARAEAQRVLVAHVLSLAEPWRSTLLWHHFDGESCEHIARRTGFPPSTVRNRVVEARARLRERLARERRDWMSALSPLTLPPGASDTASSAGPVGLSVAMSAFTKLGVAAAAGLLALGAWWLVASGGRGADEIPLDVATAPESEIERETVEHAIDARAERTAALRAPNTRATEDIAPPAPGEILVRVVEDGHPCTGGGMARLGTGQREGFVATLELALTDDGSARFTAVAAQRGEFVLEHLIEVELADGTRTRSSPMRMTEGAGREYVVRVGTARVFGTVWDSAGGPIAGITVRLGCVASPPNDVDAWRSAVTDASGRYSIERLPAGPCHAHVSIPLADSRARIGREEHPRFELARDESHRLDFGTADGWPSWTGHVRTRGGSPTMDAIWVRVQSARSTANSWALQRVAMDGSFAVRVPPGEHRVEVRRDLDWGVVHEVESVVVGPRGLAQDVELPGTRLSGRVLPAEGSARDVDFAELTISARLEQAGYAGGHQAWRVAADGTFAIDALAPGTYELSTQPHALAPDSAAVRVQVDADDVEVHADVQLAPR